ncbi:hypothetical protein QYM36_006045, partial [Artemia franciscana]
ALCRVARDFFLNFWDFEKAKWQLSSNSRRRRRSVSKLLKMNSQQDIGLKRQAEDTVDNLRSSDESDVSAKKRPSPPITPLSVFNQLYGNPKFNATAEGPPHMLEHTVSFQFSGKEFSSTAPTKKKASQDAAFQALKYVASKNVEGAETENMTLDEISKLLLSKPATEKARVAPVIPELPTDSSSPAGRLYMFDSTLTFNFASSDANDGSRYTCTVTKDGKTFTGRGASKKAAKHDVASQVLQAFYSNFPASEDSNSSDLQLGLNPTLADRISSLVEQKYSDLTKNSTIALRFQVLSGIVLERPNDAFEVITLTTGTKVISGDHLSLLGHAVNDCHAEILARRCLRQFLYMQIEEAIDNGSFSNDILRFDPIKKKFSLQEGCRLHLYINTAPCGDARIFVIQDQGSSAGNDPNPNRKSRGRLRMKIEVGMGTVFSQGRSVQTWDGIKCGERLLTMSCSDKLAACNVLGIQGALLAHFFDPIYLDGITIGTCFSLAHLQRATYGRYEPGLEPLPESYRMNEPSFSQPSRPKGRIPISKATSTSLAWTKGWDFPEYINGETGMLLDKRISKLSKAYLFGKFKSIAMKLSDHVAKKVQDADYYCDAKHLSIDYQHLFQKFYIKLKRACFTSC